MDRAANESAPCEVREAGGDSTGSSKRPVGEEKRGEAAKRIGVWALGRKSAPVVNAGVRDARTPCGCCNGLNKDDAGLALAIGAKVQRSGRSGAWQRAAWTGPWYLEGTSWCV